MRQNREIGNLPKKPHQAKAQQLLEVTSSVGIMKKGRLPLRIHFYLLVKQIDHLMSET